MMEQAQGMNMLKHGGKAVYAMALGALLACAATAVPAMAQQNGARPARPPTDTRETVRRDNERRDDRRTDDRRSDDRRYDNQRDDDRPSPHQTRPLPEIVAHVQGTPPYNDMDYIGVAGFQTRTMIYVLRFLDGRQVVVVHVDARSGRIVGRAP
jgi:hypothetical protein